MTSTTPSSRRTISTAQRWTEQQAWEWFNTRGYKQGANYVPSTASNQLEMWQSETWDEEIIQRELTWANSVFGNNAMRVFLHNLVWENEGDGFLDRVDEFLGIAHSVDVQIMLVLFDGVWDPLPIYGTQPKPRPHVHNSRWVQSPGKTVLANETAHDDMRPYVDAVIRRFGNDSRVLLFDLFNEPDNDNRNSYGDDGGPRVDSAQDAMGTELAPQEKTDAVNAFLGKVMSWARAVGPIQTPLTVGVWSGVQPQTKQWALEHSDVISFHNYQDIAGMMNDVKYLQSTTDRPLICSEYMARPFNSTFDPILGYLMERNVWAFNWGLVKGMSQTIYPWDSWNVPYTHEPPLWFHNVFREDGTPYHRKEVGYITMLWASFPASTANTTPDAHGNTIGPVVIVVPVLVLVIGLVAVIFIIRRGKSTDSGHESVHQQEVIPSHTGNDQEEEEGKLGLEMGEFS